VLVGAAETADLGLFRAAVSLLNNLDDKMRIYAHPAFNSLAPGVVARLLDVLVGMSPKWIVRIIYVPVPVFRFMDYQIESPSCENLFIDYKQDLA
jgi:hypothetical protein